MSELIENICKETTARQSEIVEEIKNALSKLSFTVLGAGDLRRFLLENVKICLQVLCSPHYENESAEEVGVNLASLHFIQPNVLGKVQYALSTSIMHDMSAVQVQWLQPRLTKVLTDLSIGYCKTSRIRYKTTKARLCSHFPNSAEHVL